ncbi:MAG: CD1871A family CXXC motif-containing protein [Marinisporobacter sp.]|jgi:hypothetical protein|nr:CD1871A family CXXC motif-containing protein [Marinisporobacter sp.]
MNKKILRYTVFLGSIAFVITGVYRNEVQTVLQKAINICLECIGIG